MPNFVKKFSMQEAVFALILVAAFFALMNVIARFLNTGFTIYEQTYLRAGIAFIFAVFIFRKKIRWSFLRTLHFKEWLLLAFRGTIHFLGVALAAYGAIHTQISHVGFISAVPFVPLLGFLLLREKMTWGKAIFIVSSFLGVILIAVKDINGLTNWNHADLIVLLSTVLFALGFVGRKWHHAKLNDYEITTLILFFGAVSIFGVSLGVDKSLPLTNWTWSLLGVLLFTGIINIVGMQLLNFGFGKLDAVRADNLLTLKTAFGVLFGFMFYQEIPTLRSFIGGLIIVACVIGMSLLSKRVDKIEATEQLG
jgi:drug/metabolite transporter (DMT)-like permease